MLGPYPSNLHSIITDTTALVILFNIYFSLRSNNVEISAYGCLTTSSNRLWGLPSGSFDVLESLTALVHEASQPWSPTATALHSALRLSSLTLEYECVADSDLQTITRSIPWSRLTHLRICSRTPWQPVHSSNIFHILPTCTSLVHCSLAIGIAEDIDGNASTIAVLPNLRILHHDLHAMLVYHSALLLRSLTLPSLEELEISPKSRRLTVESEVFESFACSGFTLKKLLLTNIDARREDMIERRLRTAPSLLFLSIDTNLRPAAIAKVSQYELVPRLQTLRTVWNVNSEFLAMIDSRRPRRSHLFSGSLTISSEMPYRDRRWIR